MKILGQENNIRTIDDKGEMKLDPKILKTIRKTHRYGLRFQTKNVKTPETIDNEDETFFDRNTFRAAYLAVANSLEAAKNASIEGTFALVRPPGHHAHRDYTHGFCIFNNMAIVAKYLSHRRERVLVLDLDIHHGCGTEELLEAERNVNMVSIYQKNIWPGNEHYKFARNCVHIPLDNKVNDERFQRIIQRNVVRQLNRVQPSVVGISLGIDTFDEENLGWKLTTDSIIKLQEILRHGNQKHFFILYSNKMKIISLLTHFK